MWRIGEIEGHDGNDQVDQDAQRSLQVVGLSVANEVSDNNDREDQEANEDGREVKILIDHISILLHLYGSGQIDLQALCQCPKRL